ncbi:hypothetical protein BGZ65_004000 [Modicella reniformis]|uniref:Uncharacterized protein n=1 Tax=Modicella reniformis TaxID=1440133 RepID=A0A9P6IZ20_9FUNG|nr:hypothetical protein BGZ65_004000 [Modicella reniformis]
MATHKPTVTEKDIEWFSANDDQAPEAFFNHLRTINRRKAQLRYCRVLRDCDLSDACRKRLEEEFEAWKSEEADAYWEEQERQACPGPHLFAHPSSLQSTSWNRMLGRRATSSSADGNEDTTILQPCPGSKRSSVSSASAEQNNPTKKLKKSKQDLAIDRRSERFLSLDQSRFWRLSSGKVVEETLYRASLEPGASTRENIQKACSCLHEIYDLPFVMSNSVRSYTIDVSCLKTRDLFTSQEWDEVLSSVSFQLPQLHKTTLTFIEKLRRNLCENKYPYTVSLPDDPTMSDSDRFDCNLAVKTVVEWHMLYTKEPTPFIVDDLSESWWARTSWALLFNLVDDIPGIFMIDGEKRGLDSSKRRNMGRYIGQYTLCPVNGELKKQFQGLARLHQIRASMKYTIQLYNSLIGPGPSDAYTTAEPESDNNLDWYYDEPIPRFDPNLVVPSSPIGAEYLHGLDELPSDAEDPLLSSGYACAGAGLFRFIGDAVSMYGPVILKEKTVEAIRLFQLGYSTRQVAQTLNISQTSASNILKMSKKNMPNNSGGRPRKLNDELVEHLRPISKEVLSELRLTPQSSQYDIAGTGFENHKRLFRFDGKLTSEQYIHMDKDDIVLQQDNDLKHASKATRHYLSSKNISEAAGTLLLLASS